MSAPDIATLIGEMGRQHEETHDALEAEAVKSARLEREVERLTRERDEARNALATTSEEGSEVIACLGADLAAYDACECDEHCAFERVKARREEDRRKVDEVRRAMAGVKP